MSFDADTLYALLPAIHRQRDAALASGEAGPLRALLGIIAEQLLAIEASLAQLSDDSFIETCADWVVPYIGDLVGYRPVRSGGQPIVSRSEVANTVRYRRAKGTTAVIEAIARDLTQRDVKVEEFFRTIAGPQYLNHLRPGAGTASLADATAFLHPGAPFDTVPRGVEARSAAFGGRYGIANLGCSFWCWSAETLPDSTPVALDPQRFLFSPLGIDAPLTTTPVPPGPDGGLAGPVDVPLPLTRRADPASATVTVSIDGRPVTPVAFACLDDTGPDAATAAWANPPPSGVAVDPERGRFMLATAPGAGQTLRVTVTRAANGWLGGGAYGRAGAFDLMLPVKPVPGAPTSPVTLADALSPAPAGSAAIEITDNVRIAGAACPATITVAAGCALEIRAADGIRPVLAPVALIVLAGGAGSTLTLDGFLIVGGALSLPATSGGQTNALQTLRLRNCTLVPGLSLGRTGLSASPATPSLTVAVPGIRVELHNCICGPIQIEPGTQLALYDTILDAGDPTAPVVAGPTGALHAGAFWSFNSTVRGTVSVALLAIVSNSIFIGLAAAAQRQDGIVRFSWLDPASTAPRRHACLPTTANPAVPMFRSRRFGETDYFRLSASCSAAILTGADDGGEMGAFHGLQSGAREDGVRVRLGEFMRFGREAGFLHVAAPRIGTVRP